MASGDDQKVRSRLKFLSAKLAAREQKYLRNYNRFLTNGGRNEGIRTVYNSPYAYTYPGPLGDANSPSPIPQINVLRSVALSLQSKIIQSKGRLFFDNLNGLWDTIKTTRNAQIFFDEFADRDRLHKKVKNSVLDALVFDMGAIAVDEISKQTIRLKPWEVYVDAAQYNADKVIDYYFGRDAYPLAAVPDIPAKNELLNVLESEPARVGRYIVYYNLATKQKWRYFDDTFLDTTPIKFEKPNFALLFFTEPIKGFYTTGVVDDALPIQRQIDELLVKIHEAIRVSPANTVFVPYLNMGNQAEAESFVKKFSNRVGQIVPYNAGAGAIAVATPPAIDPSFISMLTFFETEIYNMIGISQLSAQSKKPADVESGKALDTLQDVESERFQAFVDQVIQFYRDIYDIMIDVFQDDDEVLPTRRNRAKVTWKDIRAQRDNYSLSSSIASALSKDPSVKIEQIEKLQSMNLVSPFLAGQLLEIPDLDRAYVATNASADYAMKIIGQAIDNDKYDFYPYTNLQQLLYVAVNTLLQLDAADEKPVVLQRCAKLVEIVMAKIKDKNNLQSPPPAPPPPPTPLQGPQVTALLGILAEVKSGTLTPEQGVAATMLAFPELPQDQVLALFQVQPPAPPTPPEAQEGPVPAPETTPVPSGPPIPPQGPQLPGLLGQTPQG